MLSTRHRVGGTKNLRDVEKKNLIIDKGKSVERKAACHMGQALRR